MNAIADACSDLPAPLLHTRDGRGVHSLVLNRPAAFNTLGEEMLAALQAALDAVARDDSARIVVLSAQGKAFCAGHNLKEMRAQPELAYYQKLFAQCSRMMMSMQNLPVPVIARVALHNSRRYAHLALQSGFLLHLYFCHKMRSVCFAVLPFLYKHGGNYRDCLFNSYKDTDTIINAALWRFVFGEFNSIGSSNLK